MANYPRYNQLKKGEFHHHLHVNHHHQQQSEEYIEALALVCANSFFYKRKKPKLLYLLFISLLCFCLILTPHVFCSSSAFSLLYSYVVETDDVVVDMVHMDSNAPLCSSISDGSMCCDRTSFRTDVCVMKGDVRTQSVSSSILLYTSTNVSVDNHEIQHEKIKPYTRKWETSVMDTIDQLDLISKPEKFAVDHRCDVKHNVPAVFFSTGGYTGNVYHEFNDGILPLYITSQHFRKKVVFVILEYHDWWMMKYENILVRLSDYPVIDFGGDKRTHCFPEAIVGLRIHDELAVNPNLMPGNKSIADFRSLLDKAYRPRIRGLIREEEAEEKLKQKVHHRSPSSGTLSESRKPKKPKLVILSRNGSRSITNEDLLVKMAEEIGFRVEVLRPERTTELAKIYRALNSSEVMVGVHGAAMTHFLFMKPGSVFIQVIPLGTEWAAETYYGEPAKKLSLKYTGYQISARESSLYDKYDENDPVLRDPVSVAKKGWQYTKTIYLENQNVRLNLQRFRKRLVRAYQYSTEHRNRNFRHRSL